MSPLMVSSPAGEGGGALGHVRGTAHEERDRVGLGPEVRTAILGRYRVNLVKTDPESPRSCHWSHRGRGRTRPLPRSRRRHPSTPTEAPATTRPRRRSIRHPGPVPERHERRIENLDPDPDIESSPPPLLELSQERGIGKRDRVSEQICLEWFITDEFRSSNPLGLVATAFATTTPHLDLLIQPDPAAVFNARSSAKRFGDHEHVAAAIEIPAEHASTSWVSAGHDEIRRQECILHGRGLYSNTWTQPAPAVPSPVNNDWDGAPMNRYPSKFSEIEYPNIEVPPAPRRGRPGSSMTWNWFHVPPEKLQMYTFPTRSDSPGAPMANQFPPRNSRPCPKNWLGVPPPPSPRSSGEMVSNTHVEFTNA